MKKNLVVGLTGGIACGKSTVAKLFRDFGAHTIDADLLGHQVLKDDYAVKKQIVDAFGQRILDDRGEIDRSKLGRVVFDSPDSLKRLNELVHPAIARLMEAEIKQKLSSAEQQIVIVDAALLIEANLTYMVDIVVVVCADEDVQIQRLVQRGLSSEDARKRIGSQMSSDEKARSADFVINNNGSLSCTAEQVGKVWDALTKMTGRGSV